MTQRENELPSYPFVEAALAAIADWVTSYRNAVGLKNEFGMCGPEEVARMAKDIGVTPSHLQELVRKGPDSANLLKRMLVGLHVDPKIIADIDPLVMREMNWLCITCGNKKRCKHELAKGTATEHFHEFCPNAVSIDELLDQNPTTLKRCVSYRHVRFGSKADMCSALGDVCFVPIADITRSHSITLSARPISVFGTLRPSAFAVLRLIYSSNLVGCSTGSSPGFIPFNILSTYPAARRKRSASLGP